MNLLGRCKIAPAVVPTAGSVANLTPVEVDGRGFDRAMFIFALGAAASGGTFDAKIQNSATAGGTLADMTDAALTQVVEAGASKVYAIDVRIDPARPYMKVTGAVGTATFANGAVAVLYEGSGTFPKTAAAEAVIAS